MYTLAPPGILKIILMLGPTHGGSRAIGIGLGQRWDFLKPPR